MFKGYTCNTIYHRPGPTAKEIIANIKKLKEELNEPPIIEVWIGDKWMQTLPLTEYPLIRENPNIDKDEIFILAGSGVFAGVDAYKKLWEIGYLAIWVEDPPGDKK